MNSLELEFKRLTFNCILNVTKIALALAAGKKHKAEELAIHAEKELTEYHALMEKMLQGGHL